MQNLRDQLQKAGLVSKQQQRQVEQNKRRERKKHRKGHIDEVMQAQQQAYETKVEAQRAADRQRAAMQRAQQEAKEKRLQIRHLIDYWNVPVEPVGDRRWYFTTRDNTITYLYVSKPLATQLDAGALAIVERPDEPDTPFTLVDHEAAEIIARIDPQYVRFYNERTRGRVMPEETREPQTGPER